MARKLPKHVKPTGSTLGYQRAIPTKLRHVSPIKNWTYPLGVPATASDSEIATAWAKANEAFELHCKTLTNSSPAAYTETEVERLAEDFLRRKSLTWGQFSDVVDPEVRAREQEAQQDLQAYPSDYADHHIPEYDQVQQEIYKDGNRPPTLQERVVIRAWEAVQTRRKSQPRTLTTLWKAYLQHRGVNVDNREGQRIQRRWDKFISVVRDTVVAPDTPDHIELGLDDYVDQELERGIAPSSIKRNLREPLACLKWANRQYRLKWRPIELRDMRPHRPKEKKPLSVEHQLLLLESAKQKQDWVSAALIMMLQGGCMPTELARLRPEQDICLDAEIPHIVISGGDEGRTKQEARKRIVPVVLELDLLKSCLIEAVERLATVKEPSATLSKRLRAHVSPEYSSHCLRHTFRANGTSAGANPLALEAIGGWSGSNVNKVMLGYGASGISNSEVLRQLQAENKKIHAHLL